MANLNDPNFGMVGGDKDSFEEWGNNLINLNNPDNFDLLEYVGADEEQYEDNVEYGNTSAGGQDTKQAREDKLYAMQQYNQLMFGGDNQNNGPYGLENQYGVNQYMPGTSDGRGVLSNSIGYGNMDSSMIPTTSKNSMPMPIKVEPGYEVVDNSGTRLFDDSGAYSDADSYAHSIGSMDGNGGYQPKTKPRKYRVKPDEEKKNPVYKVKREKNNDAVRRSRDKAKRIQLEKEERLSFLEQEKVKDSRTIQSLTAKNERLQQQINSILSRCSCGAAVRM